MLPSRFSSWQSPGRAAVPTCVVRQPHGTALFPEGCAQKESFTTRVPRTWHRLPRAAGAAPNLQCPRPGWGDLGSLGWGQGPLHVLMHLHRNIHVNPLWSSPTYKETSCLWTQLFLHWEYSQITICKILAKFWKTSHVCSEMLGTRTAAAWSTHKQHNWLQSGERCP